MTLTLDKLVTVIESLCSLEAKEATWQDIDLKFCKQKDPVSCLIDDAVLPAGGFIQASLHHSDSTADCMEVSHPVSISKRVESLSNNSDEPEMEGSPLKLHDYQKDFKTSESSNDDSILHCESEVKRYGTGIAQPLTVKKARFLVSMYTLACRKLSASIAKVLPLVVVCDGNDPQHLVYMMSDIDCHAARPNEKNFTDKTAFMYKSYIVTVSDKRTEKAKLPSIEGLVGKAFLSLPYKIQHSAEYELVAASDDLDSTLDNQRQLSATFKWSRPSALLAEPHLDATATVIAVVRPEDPRSAISPIYKELCMLKGLVVGLQEGSIMWSVKDSDISLASQVKQLIQDLKMGDMKQTAKSTESDDMPGSKDQTTSAFTRRQDLDFTEQIWNILKDCCHHSDLEESLQIILDSLSSKQLQPMVHQNNDTQLAKLVRESYYGRMSITSIKLLKPIEILIEIGIDKLIRDYSYTLIGMELATAHHLKPFITSCADGIQLSERIKLLEKLHFVVELVAMLHQYVELPKSSTSCAARMALKHYMTHDASSGEKFNVPIPAVSVTAVMKNPSIWRVMFQAEKSEGHLFKVILLTLDCPVSHFHTQILESDNESSTGYYLTMIECCVDVI